MSQNKKRIAEAALATRVDPDDVRLVEPYRDRIAEMRAEIGRIIREPRVQHEAHGFVFRWRVSATTA
jgi:hypothetical protein